MTTSEMIATLTETYDADVSLTLISKVTNALIKNRLLGGKIGLYMRYIQLFILTLS